MLGRLVHLFHRGPVKVLMVDVDRLIAGHCSRTLVLTVNKIHGQEVGLRVRAWGRLRNWAPV